MKKTAVCLCVFVFAAAACVSAAPNASAGESRVGFFVEPLLLKGLGGTAYDLTVNVGGGQSELSRLEFPMFSLEAGLSAGLTIDTDGKRAWLFEASAAHSTLAIQGRMNDYDWFGLTGFPNLPWSYTYSRDTTVSWRASAGVAWMFGSLGPIALSLYATYHFQYANHVEDTIVGWQYAFDPVTDKPTDTGWISEPDTDVLEYTLTAHMPGLGLMADWEVLPGWSLDLRACVTAVYISDKDDHKVRTKLSTASGWGPGLYADLRATYRFARQPNQPQPYLALDGEFISYAVSTSQTQYWYGTGDKNVAQGTTLTGVGHVVSSTQFQIGLRFGFAF